MTKREAFPTSRETATKVSRIMVDINEIDARVLEAMSGRTKVLVLLEDAGYPTIKDVSKATGQWAQDISSCLRGTSEHPAVRDAIAGLLKLERTDIDQLLGSDAGSAIAAA